MFALNDRRLNRSLSNEAAEIAQIEIVFDKNALVELFKQRGRALYDGDYERAQELTVEIRREAMQDARALEEPHYAYVTFASEEGYARALNYTHRRYSVSPRYDNLHYFSFLLIVPTSGATSRFTANLLPSLPQSYGRTCLFRERRGSPKYVVQSWP